jgi:hypothetical protein
MHSNGLTSNDKGFRSGQKEKITTLCFSLRNLTELFLDKKEAPKNLNLLAFQIILSRAALYTAPKLLKLWQHKVRAVQEPFSRLGSKKAIFQMTAAFSN